MGFSKYFSFEELVRSNAANILGIKNKPNEQDTENLKELAAVLDTIREKWGSAIQVNSGYRCKELNKAIGGSKSSVHVIGLAADLYPCNHDFNGFVNCVLEWANDNKFDQIFIETNERGSKWLHFGLKNNLGKQRKQIKEIEAK